MSRKSLTYMIHLLVGTDRGAEFIAECLGIEIKEILIDSEELIIRFVNGKGIIFWDDGQCCCESRYMHTDDDLPYYAGSRLMNVELRDGPEEETEWGECTESQFLLVTTDKGVITVVNYNDHNGWYGGFVLRAREEKKAANKED